MTPKTAAARPPPFWHRKTLARMNTEEWESLCDGCARCCLEKLEDSETGEFSYTDIGCRLLDVKTCRCTNYAERKRFMPDCERLTPGNISFLKWMPSTCAYKLLSEGRDLPDWHPLVTGDPDSAHKAGISVRGRAVAAEDAGDFEDHIVTWPK